MPGTCFSFGTYETHISFNLFESTRIFSNYLKYLSGFHAVNIFFSFAVEIK